MRSLVVFLIALLSIITQAHGKETHPPDAERMFLFADHAFALGEYDTAISEFARFLYFYPDDSRKEEALYKTGMSHFRQGRFGKAAEVFDQVIQQYEYTDYAIESAFMGAEIDQRLDDYNAAYYRLNALTHERFGPETRDRALFQIGWLFLEIRDHASAGRAFNAISDSRKSIYRADAIGSRLEDLASIPTKSPVAAGVLSIFPGGGYLYTGRYQDALISFVFIAAGAGAAYESFDNDLNILGSIAALVTAGFYSGSAYGSIGAAHKYNTRTYDDFIDNLKQNTPVSTLRPAFGLIPQQNAVYLTLDVSF